MFTSFDTYTPLTAGVSGTAPVMFCASTDQTLVALTATGALNYLGNAGIIKQNDYFLVNYLATTQDLSTAVLAQFRVQITGSDYSLVAFP